MSSICIIPARGGSKRIPQKNIRPFCGQPIIAYSIEVAIGSSLFDRVMVSTDDPEIAIIARQYGAEVPFFRSEQTSADTATTAEMLLEVLSAFQQQRDYFDTACCLYATAPFVTPERLWQAFELLQKGNYDTVFPVVPFSYPIYRGLTIADNGSIGMIWPEYKSSRSQDLPDSYHDAGQFYFFQTKHFFEKRELFTDHCAPLVLDETEAQDIDTLTDWKLAELKYRMIHALG